MKKLAILLASVLMMTFACAAVAESVSIAIVYSDTVDDKGWCQSMDNGVKNAIAKGYEIDYTPVESVQVPDAPNTLDQLAENYDIIIVHGAQFTAATTEIAAEYPDQVFAIGTSDPGWHTVEHLKQQIAAIDEQDPFHLIPPRIVYIFVARKHELWYNKQTTQLL